MTLGAGLLISDKMAERLAAMLRWWERTAEEAGGTGESGPPISRGRPQPGRIGKIQSAGPGGEADYGNHRYWVCAVQCSNESGDATAALALAEITDPADPNYLWTTATHPAEESGGTHGLPAGTLVRIWPMTDGQNPAILRWEIETPGGGGSTRIQYAKVHTAPSASHINAIGAYYLCKTCMRDGTWIAVNGTTAEGTTGTTLIATADIFTAAMVGGKVKFTVSANEYTIFSRTNGTTVVLGSSLAEGDAQAGLAFKVIAEPADEINVYINVAGAWDTTNKRYKPTPVHCIPRHYQGTQQDHSDAHVIPVTTDNEGNYISALSYVSYYRMDATPKIGTVQWDTTDWRIKEGLDEIPL